MMYHMYTLPLCQKHFKHLNIVCVCDPLRGSFIKGRLHQADKLRHAVTTSAVTPVRSKPLLVLTSVTTPGSQHCTAPSQQAATMHCDVS